MGDEVSNSTFFKLSLFIVFLEAITSLLHLFPIQIGVLEPAHTYELRTLYFILHKGNLPFNQQVHKGNFRSMNKSCPYVIKKFVHWTEVAMIN